jgi:hypothetical protein
MDGRVSGSYFCADHPNSLAWHGVLGDRYDVHDAALQTKAPELKRSPYSLLCNIVGSARAHFGEKGVYRQRDAEQHNFGLLAVRLECVVTDSGS